MPVDHQGLDALHRLQGAAPRAVGVLLRLQVGLEDRLQDHQGGRLYYPVLDRRDAQRPRLAVRLGDVHPPHGSRTIRPPADLFRQLAQPLRRAVVLDVVERLAVHPRGAAVSPAALVGVGQHVRPIRLFGVPHRPAPSRFTPAAHYSRRRTMATRWSAFGTCRPARRSRSFRPARTGTKWRQLPSAPTATRWRPMARGGVCCCWMS
jgi:hypothetical protein